MRNSEHTHISDNSNALDSLPTEISAPITRSRFIRIAAVAVLTVVSVNFLVSISGVIDRIDSGGQIIQKKWDILGSLEQPADWLILGDSSADQGVVPDNIEEALGGTAVNLATVGDLLAVNDVWMLDEHIDRYGPPTNVIMIHVYDMWRREPETSAFAKVPQLPGFWWTNEPHLGFTFQESAEFLAFKYLPLFQSENLLRELKADPGKLRRPPRSIQADGFTTVVEPQPARVEDDFNVHKTYYSQAQFEISETNQLAMDRLVELTTKYEFNVYIANSPLYEKMRSDLEFQTFFVNVQRLLFDLDERSPYIHYVLCDTPGFPKEMMTNVDHLTLEGAQAFTALLTESIGSNEACETAQ